MTGRVVATPSGRSAGRWTATLVGAMCAVLSLSACGEARSGVQPGAPEVVAAESAARQLYVRIAGTPAQQEAGQRRQHVRMQRTTQACMRKAGFAYEIPAFVDVHGGGPRLDVMAETDWLAPLGSTGLLERAQLTRTLADSIEARESGTAGPYARLSPADKRRYAGAISACAQEAAVHEGSARPPGAYDVLGRFHAMVRAADEGVDAEAYRSCMQADGFTVSGHRELVAAVRERIPPLEAVPPTGAKGTGAWEATTAYERRITGTDARCRAAEHAEAYARLGPELERFQRDNRAALTRLAGEWAAIGSGGA